MAMVLQTPLPPPPSEHLQGLLRLLSIALAYELFMSDGAGAQEAPSAGARRLTTTSPFFSDMVTVLCDYDKGRSGVGVD